MAKIKKTINVHKNRAIIFKHSNYLKTTKLSKKI